MTPHKVPEGHDHFYGFSRWSKECMPYDAPPNNFYWMDIDCIFPNQQTGDVHVIEIKLNNATVKPYQGFLLKWLESKGAHIHILRMQFNEKYYGDHDNLGDPRLAEKITLNDIEITVEKLKEILCEWHGIKQVSQNVTF